MTLNPVGRLAIFFVAFFSVHVNHRIEPMHSFNRIHGQKVRIVRLGYYQTMPYPLS